MENSPCFKCEDRDPECHGKCKKYIKWKADQGVIKSIIDNEKKAYYDYIGDIMAAKKRTANESKRGARKRKGW